MIFSVTFVDSKGQRCELGPYDEVEADYLAWQLRKFGARDVVVNNLGGLDA